MTLVERLRLYADASVSDGEPAMADAGTVREAADRIEQLEGVLRAVWKDVFEDGGPIYSDTRRKIYAALKENEKGR